MGLVMAQGSVKYWTTLFQVGEFRKQWNGKQICPAFCPQKFP